MDRLKRTQKSLLPLGEGGERSKPDEGKRPVASRSLNRRKCYPHRRFRSRLLSGLIHKSEGRNEQTPLPPELRPLFLNHVIDRAPCQPSAFALFRQHVARPCSGLLESSRLKPHCSEQRRRTHRKPTVASDLTIRVGRSVRARHRRANLFSQPQNQSLTRHYPDSGTSAF